MLFTAQCILTNWYGENLPKFVTDRTSVPSVTPVVKGSYGTAGEKLSCVS